MLAALRRSGEPYRLTPTKLAEEALISTAGMTNRLDRLEQAGLVERLPDPDDRRGVLVELTGEGRELVDSAVDAHRGLSRRLSRRARGARAGRVRPFAQEAPRPARQRRGARAREPIPNRACGPKAPPRLDRRPRRAPRAPRRFARSPVRRAPVRCRGGSARARPRWRPSPRVWPRARPARSRAAVDVVFRWCSYIGGFARVRSSAQPTRYSLEGDDQDTRPRPRHRARRSLDAGGDRTSPRGVHQLRPRRVADAREALPSESPERGLPGDAGARRGARDPQVDHVVPGQPAPRAPDGHGNRDDLGRRQRRAGRPPRCPCGDGPAHRRRRGGGEPGARAGGRAHRRARRLRAARHLGRPLHGGQRVRAGCLLRSRSGRGRERRGRARLGGGRPRRRRSACDIVCTVTPGARAGRPGRLARRRPAPEPARRRRPREGRGGGRGGRAGAGPKVACSATSGRRRATAAS